ncbi:MAG: nitroreductase family protein [Thermoplasmatota archaeon]
MDLMTGILTRRSIRTYTTTAIDNKIITSLIKAGMAAPSAGNQQPWQFIVISDKNLLKEVSSYLPKGGMLSQADKGICVCGDLNAERYKGYWMVDCSAATQNILLAAHYYGIGSCWLGVYPREERIKNLQNVFRTPSHIIPFAVVSLGYSGEKSGVVDDRFDESLIHHNSW